MLTRTTEFDKADIDRIPRPLFAAVDAKGRLIDNVPASGVPAHGHRTVDFRPYFWNVAKN